MRTDVEFIKTTINQIVTQQIAQRDYDALDAYDGAGCFMPEGGLSDAELSICELNDWLISVLEARP